jgi:FkbM family methyltransferase
MFSFGAITKIKSKIFLNPIQLRRKDSDLDIFDQIFVDKQYKWPEIEKLNPKVILDGGANIGLSAIFFSNLFPAAKIICIEPDENNWKQLEANTKNYKNISLVKAAIWYKNEILNLANPEGFSAGFSYQSENNDKGVQGCTIQEIMAQFNLNHIDILKLDIEGAEKEIFENGNLEWLDKTDVLTIELHDMYREGTAKAFIKPVHDKIEKMYIQGENVICYFNNLKS